MQDATALETLIREIMEAMLEYDRLAFDEEKPHELGPPASPKQIAKLESILGKSLPPSYRAFLELHNGWSHFDGGAKLLAVEDHESKWVKGRLQEFAGGFEGFAENPFEIGAIPVLLGTHENNFLVLDPGKVRKTGEMDFVAYDSLEEEDRFKDFTSYLRGQLEVLRRLIEIEKHGTRDEEEDEEE
jgi:hypothetical protein